MKSRLGVAQRDLDGFSGRAPPTNAPQSARKYTRGGEAKAAPDAMCRGSGAAGSAEVQGGIRVRPSTPLYAAPQVKASARWPFSKACSRSSEARARRPQRRDDRGQHLASLVLAQTGSGSMPPCPLRRRIGRRTGGLRDLIQDPASELPRITLPRTLVKQGRRTRALRCKGRGAGPAI
jgi:hypothetical protein